MYADSSALLKLVVSEPESPVLESYLERADRVFSSEITDVEVVRVARRLEGERGIAKANEVLEKVSLLEFDSQARQRAKDLEPTTLRSLDAIQVAAALHLQYAEVVFIGYDKRLQEAAKAAGLKIESPGA